MNTEKKTKKTNNRKTIVMAIAVFYGIAVILRYLTNETALMEEIDSSFIKILLQGIGPAVGALVAVKLFHLPFRMTLKGNFNSLFVPLTVYWLLLMLVVGLVAYFTKGTFPVVVVLEFLLYGLLEEIGWRGFLQPLLSPLPKMVSILVVTVLWFVWHLNFDLTSSNLIFFFILLLGTWGIGLVGEKTLSLLAVAAFHSLSMFFVEINVQKGILLAVFAMIWILSVVFRHKLEKIGRKMDISKPSRA